MIRVFLQQLRLFTYRQREDRDNGRARATLTARVHVRGLGAIYKTVRRFFELRDCLVSESCFPRDLSERDIWYCGGSGSDSVGRVAVKLRKIR